MKNEKSRMMKQQPDTRDAPNTPSNEQPPNAGFSNRFTWCVVRNLAFIAGKDGARFFSEDYETIEQLAIAIDEYVHTWLIPDPTFYPVDMPELISDLVHDALEEVDWEEVAAAFHPSRRE